MADGDPINALGPRHAFWTAVTLWAHQGERVEDGVCVWDRPPQPITEHVGGKHHRVVGYTSAERGS